MSDWIRLEVNAIDVMRFSYDEPSNWGISMLATINCAIANTEGAGPLIDNYDEVKWAKRDGVIMHRVDWKDAYELYFKRKGKHMMPTKPGEAMAQKEMPRYKCHKEVWALKIERVEEGDHVAGETGSPGATITPGDEGFAPFEVDGDFIDKHAPKVGGYYIVYEDGYKSFSPADVFEKCYTPIT